MSGVQIPNTPVPPPVKWAQRSGIVYLTICVEDCKCPVLKFENDSLFFSGFGGSSDRPYEVTISFYKEILPEETKKNITGRVIELVLKKKEDGYWPHLCKEKTKYGYLSVDFSKWLDETDSEEETGGGNGRFENMMNMMGGMDVDGYSQPDLNDMDDSDTSEGELPELEEADKVSSENGDSENEDSEDGDSEEEKSPVKGGAGDASEDQKKI